MELTAFGEGEDILACEFVLLHPYDTDQLIMAGVSDKAWAFNDEIDEDVSRYWEERFSKRLQGLPHRLSNEVFYATAEDSVRDQFVIEARDQDVLKQVLGQEER
jgi:hypothetical protein